MNAIWQRATNVQNAHHVPPSGEIEIFHPMHVLDEDNVLGPNHFQQASVEPHTDVDCDRYQEIRQCMPWGCHGVAVLWGVSSFTSFSGVFLQF